MSERLHEQLSALLDGELPTGEAELLLARLQRDPGLRATLGRYTLAGDAIRISGLEAAAQVAPVASAGFASRISAAIEAEEQQQASVLAGLGVVQQGVAQQAAPLADTAASTVERVPAAVRGGRRAVVRRWLRPLGGVAVAASVAGLALMALPRGPGGAPVPQMAQQMDNSVPSSSGAGGSVRAPGTFAVPATEVGSGAAAAPLPVLVAATENVRSASAESLGEPASYTTPLAQGGQGGPAPTFIPAAELASYVVAHSEVSGPLARRNVLTGLVAEPVPARVQTSVPSPAQSQAQAQAQAATRAAEPRKP